MYWYSQGSIEVSAGGVVAAGAGTAFLQNVRLGDGLVIEGSAAMHEVTGIASDLQLSFSPPYAGAGGAGKTFRVVPVQGYVKEAADRLLQVLQKVGPMAMSEALQLLAAATDDGQRRAALGLGRVDNTADVDKPVSKAMAEALERADQKNPELVGQAEAEAGTGTSIRSWPVIRVWQASAAWFANSTFKSRLDKTISAIVGTIGPVNRIFLDVPGIKDSELTGAVAYAGALEIREVNQVATSKSGNTDYAPAITYHYGGYAVNRLWMNPAAQLFWGGSRVLLANDLEYGSNANGSYIRFPDGTQITYIYKVVNQTTQFGTSVAVGVIQPAAFVGTPSVSVTGSHRSGLDGNGLVLYSLMVNHSDGAYYLFNQGSAPANAHFTFTVGQTAAQSYVATITSIGRWK